MVLLIALVQQIVARYEARRRLRLRSYAANNITTFHAVCISTSYSFPSNSSLLSQLLEHPGTFRNLVRIEPEVFIQEILLPIYDDVTLPRGFLSNAEYIATGNVERRRSCQLNRADRILRWMLVNRGVPAQMLAVLFDQDASQVYRDYLHIAIIVFIRLSPQWLTPITLNSPEYFLKRGAGPFAAFPAALYAIDVVKVMSFPFSVCHLSLSFVCCVHRSKSKGHLL